MNKDKWARLGRQEYEDRLVSQEVQPTIEEKIKNSNKLTINEFINSQRTYNEA